eukprot:scaffold7213_cov166-Amphora_coffeaeformis.AAC.15
MIPRKELGQNVGISAGAAFDAKDAGGVCGQGLDRRRYATVHATASSKVRTPGAKTVLRNKGPNSGSSCHVWMASCRN